MPKSETLADLLGSGAARWNALRKSGKAPTEHVGATLQGLFCAGANLSELSLTGTEWEDCELSSVDFRNADLSNSYFHGGRLTECVFTGANLSNVVFERVLLKRCVFTGAEGLDEVELDDVTMRDVEGLEERDLGGDDEG